MFRRDMARAFDSRFKQLIDLELWYDFLKTGALAYTTRPLCAFRRHPHQQTSLNRRKFCGELEGVVLFARHKELIDKYVAQGGSARRVKNAAFNTVYQARKADTIPSWVQRDYEAVSSYFSGLSYGVHLLRHKLTKPFSNIARCLRKTNTTS
jgi:hypothetical protein